MIHAMTNKEGKLVVSARCISRDCGNTYNVAEPETRTGLRSFWKRYCPDCRIKGNAGSEPVVAHVWPTANRETL